MTEEEKIKSVLEQYIVAAKDGNYDELSLLCTNKMLLQFNWVFRLSMSLARIIFAKRIKNFSLHDLTIESVSDQKAIAHYSLDWGKKHIYERVVLLKENDKWHVDGKFV